MRLHTEMPKGSTIIVLLCDIRGVHIMYGWCKLLEENDNEMIISYSWQENKNCDGKLIYNKNTKEVTVSNFASGIGKNETDYFICPLRSRVRRGMEIGKRYMIATG